MTGLQKLLSVLDEMELAAARWSRRSLALTFTANHNARWEVRCTGVLESQLTVVDQCGLHVWRERHPTIDQYIQPRALLRFKAVPRHPDRVVGELWAAHRKLVDDWIPFDRYIARDQPLRSLLAKGSGLLADGPMFLIDAYAAVLDANGCAPKKTKARTKPRAMSAVMIHFGESYVVARNVNAKMVS